MSFVTIYTYFTHFVVYHHHNFLLYWTKCLYFVKILENKFSFFSLYLVTHILPLSCEYVPLEWDTSLWREAFVLDKLISQTYFSYPLNVVWIFLKLIVLYLAKVKILKEKQQNTPNLLGIHRISQAFKTLLES